MSSAANSRQAAVSSAKSGGRNAEPGNLKNGLVLSPSKSDNKLEDDNDNSQKRNDPDFKIQSPTAKKVHQEFKMLEDMFQLHPDGAEFASGMAATVSKRGRNGAQIQERIEVVKRIEAAIDNNISEISTYEFMGFHDCQAPRNCETVSCNIDLVGFKDGVYLGKYSLFNGDMTCTASGPSRYSEVVYFPIPEEFDVEATEGYLVATVHAEYPPSEEGRRRSRRGTPAEARKSCRGAPAEANNLPERRIFYGSKFVFSRIDTGLDVKFCDSSIPLKSDNELTGAWYADQKFVSDMHCALEMSQVENRIPFIKFELTDQHCDEDWVQINQRRSSRIQKKTLTDANNAQTYVVVDSIEDDENDESTSLKDISSDGNTIALCRMAQFRCPFCLKDYQDNELLKAHLECRYPFKFEFKDNNIVEVNLIVRVAPKVDDVVPAKTNDVVPSIKKASRAKYVLQSDGFILSDDLLTILPPKVTTNEFTSIGVDYCRVDDGADWVEHQMIRNIHELDTVADTVRQFMVLVNRFMKNRREPLIGQRQKIDTMKAIVNHVFSGRPLSEADQCSLLAAMTLKLHKANGISNAGFNDVVNYIFSKVNL